MSRSRRGLRVATGIAVVTVVAAACGGPSHPKSATKGTAPATVSAVAAAGAPYSWSRVSDQALAVGGGSTSTIADVVAPVTAGDSWMAVGTRAADSGRSVASGGDTTTATVWTSADGEHWSSAALPDPSSAGTPTDSQARAVARLGTTIVVVGSVGTGPSQQAAVWVSPGPGRPFRAVSAPTAFSSALAPVATGAAVSTGAGATGSGAVMDHIASGALGVFVSGTVQGRTAMWYSTDGTRWTRLVDAERVIDRADQPQINTLLVAPNGVWAAGSVMQGTDEDGAVWTSTDGIHWVRVTSADRSFTGDGDHVIEGLGTLGTGFVAVGGVRSGSTWIPASWISPDGSSWSEASESFPMTPVAAADDVGTTVEAVTEITGGGLVAVGGSPSAQRVWTSTDGLSWTEEALPGAAATATDWHLGVVAATATTTVVADDTVGQPRLLTDDNGTWLQVTASAAPFGSPAPVADPTSLVTAGGRLYLAVDVTTPGQALGPVASSVEILSSADGTSWQVDASGGPFAGHHVRALLPIETGLAAAGGQAAALTTTSSASHAPAASIWTSTTGGDWKVAPESAAVFGGGSAPAAEATALARVGLVLVAVGRGAAGITPVSGAGATAGGTGSGGASSSGASAPSSQSVAPAVTALTPGSSVPGQAVAWVSANGGPWQAAGALDASPGLGTESPEGACAGPQAVVAVGAAQIGTPGERAVAWSSPSGQTWQSATITPTPTPGEEERMTGCLTTGNGFLAYGTSAGPDGTTDPALWQSSDGTTWTRQTVTAFTGDNGGAITDLALRGTTWLAVSGASPTTPTAATASSTVGLWRSGDAGGTWAPLDTQGGPWVGTMDAQANEVGFAGADAIVAGQVDGRLAVWVGTPPPAGAAGAPPAGAGSGS